MRKLLPESLPGLDLERMVLPPGARMAGVPHTPGTREYLTCERGTVELAVAGERYALAEGDVVMFRGDQRHGYHNPGRCDRRRLLGDRVRPDGDVITEPHRHHEGSADGAFPE